MKRHQNSEKYSRESVAVAAQSATFDNGPRRVSNSAGSVYGVNTPFWLGHLGAPCGDGGVPIQNRARDTAFGRGAAVVQASGEGLFQRAPNRGSRSGKRMRAKSRQGVVDHPAPIAAAAPQRDRR